MEIEIFRSDPDNYTICQLKEILEVVLEFLVLIGISRIPSQKCSLTCINEVPRNVINTLIEIFVPCCDALSSYSFSEKRNLLYKKY